MKRFLAIFAFALSCVIANAQASNVGAGGTVYGIEKLTVVAKVEKKADHNGQPSLSCGAELCTEVIVENALRSNSE